MKSFQFKFLDSYKKEDSEIFFGRAKDIETLYERIFQTNLLIVYGATGVGKSSLIQCGLVNKLEPTGWKSLFVRKNEDINTSLLETIAKEIKTVDETLEASGDAEEDLNTLYLCYFKTIYLVFDQLEEIFVFGKEPERVKFFEFLKKLSKTKLNVKVILSLREDYLAYLSNYERILPALFDFRIRVEKLNRKELVEVITGTTTKAEIALENEFIVDKIIDNLRDKKEGVELTYLQVYLERLYKNANESTDGKVIFDTNLIDKIGKIEDVLGDFLDDEIAKVDKIVGRPVSMKVLFEMITDENTKRNVKIDAIKAKLAPIGITSKEIDICLEEFRQRRLLKLEE